MIIPDTERLKEFLFDQLSMKKKQIAPISHQILYNTTIAPYKIEDYFRYSGTVALFLLIIQFATGILLSFYYYPHPVKAFTSIITIRNDVPYGMLFLDIHAIGAKLIVLIIFVHMFKIMLDCSYKGPRTWQWYTGVALLTFMLMTGFSGYLLPWSQQSFWACVIGTEACRTIPVIGNLLVELLRGGQDVNSDTLFRFYLFHIFFLPITIVSLIYYHVKLVWKNGVIAPSDMYAKAKIDKCVGCGICKKKCSFHAIELSQYGGRNVAVIDKSECHACRACIRSCPEKCIYLASRNNLYKEERIFPQGIIHRLISIFTVLIIFGFCVYFLHGILLAEKIPADSMVTPESIKPDWYFMGPYQLLKITPGEFIGLTFMFIIFLVILFLPKIDKSGKRSIEERPIYSGIVKYGIAIFIVFTIWGWLS